jgi:uroporphyrinogen decarboxylase
VDWHELKAKALQKLKNGDLVTGEIGHGHTFLKLVQLRGYENLIFDMTDRESRLSALVGMLEEFNLGLVDNFLGIPGLEWMSYAEDLGMQSGPMLSPALFREYIKPAYERIVRRAKEAGCTIHLHSDGDIRLLVEDLMDLGVDVLNLQDLVNGIDWIHENITGRRCVELDVDRQNVTYSGTPSRIDELIKHEIEKLGSKQGGLMMIYGLYPGVPMANIKAVMDAMVKYADFYS